VKAIFDRAVEIESPADREAYLDDVCAGAPEVRQKVEAFLRAYSAAGSFLEPTSPPPPVPPVGPGTVDLQAGPSAADSSVLGATRPEPLATGDFGPGPATATFDGTPPTRRSPSPGLGPGAVIAGRYTLIEGIGEGGMGSVYLATQSEPVKRQVALKLIKTGMDSKAVLARFDAERQALALMDHPNIARVYDGGTTPAGQPFFVMELVNGVPLTEYCDARRLSVAARLHLFLSV
jgi:hypothetical protein